ncbi:MAG: hypothetical protein Q4F21_09055 [Lachnospiraceae bacterium]|nr:hypothetical protein [Lachnospiraceae bacterium]
MKKHTRKLISALLAFAMVISTMSPAAYAAPGAASKSVEATADTATGSRAETVLAAARALAKLNISTDAEKKAETPAKAAVKEAIFEEGNKTVDVSDESISADEMKTAKKAVLKENNMAGLVNVTYKTDGEGNVTSVKSDVDTQITTVIKELDSETYAAGLTDAQKEQIVAAYANYQKEFVANADYFGVQSPFFTTKDTNDSPIGSLLSIAGIPQAAIDAGQVSFDEVKGVVDLFTLANQFAVNMHGGDIIKAKDEAMKSISSDMSRIEKYLALNDWLAHWCTFDMAYIMEMPAPEPAVNEDQNVIYDEMYKQIKAQIKQQILDQLMKEYGMSEAEATPVAEAQATSMMEDDDPLGDGSPNGKTQAMTLATSVIGLWEGNNVGALINKTAVCLGYSNAYNYLVQWAFPEIYKSNGKWKTWEELNNKDGKWNKDAGYIVDYTRITFDAEVTMYGEKQDKFDSDHYWNAVKTEDGKWYYVDPCYTDIYIECMIRERVETDGNMNHLYFMISDDTVRDLYDGYYKEINTLYKGIATDKTYEDAWFAFAKGNTYLKDGKYYYFYDSTDLIDQMNEYGGNGRSSKSKTTKADNSGGLGDIMGWEDAEYKLVYHDASKADSDASFETLVDFSTGQVYNPKGGEDGKGAMEDNDLIKTLYAEFQGYAEEYPSVMIGGALYGDNFYFSLGNCILSYNLTSGEVKRLIEYNTVYGDRDMSVALGGMAFNMTSNASDAELKVENNPIADMTIKPDGKMYVSIATNAGFISGKDPRNMKDTSDYGYRFEETNYNPGYSRYMQSSYGEEEVNDNDEFMWSANIRKTIDMSHLTGSSHSYNKVDVAASCTDDEFSENRCSTCGLINGTATASAKAETHNADVNIEAEDNVAKLVINVKDHESNEVIGTGVLTETFGTESGTKYTFTKDAIKVKAEEVASSNGYTLDEQEYTDKDVNFSAVETVEFTAAKNAVEPETKATTTVSVKFAEGTNDVTKEIGTVSVTRADMTEAQYNEKPITADEIDQVCAEKIEAAGYEKDSTATVVPEDIYGKTTTVTVYVNKKATEMADATLNVTFVDKDDKTVNTQKIVKNGEKDQDATDVVKAAIEAPEGYEFTGEVTIESIKYGETKDAKITVKAVKATATLNVTFVDEDEKNVGNQTVTAEGPADDDATTAIKDQIKAPENYKLVGEVTIDPIKYGETKDAKITVKSTVVAATLVVTFVDEKNEPVGESVTLTANGTEGGDATKALTDQIKAPAEYEIVDETITTEPAVIKYGEEGKATVKVKSTAVKTADANLTVALVDANGQAIVDKDGNALTAKLPAQNGEIGKDATFAKADIIDAAKKLIVEGSNYEVDETSVEKDVTVPFGESQTVNVKANKTQGTAKLTVALVDADNKALTDADGKALTAELPAQTGNAGEEATFAKANIVDAAKGKLPEGYALKDEASVEDVKVPYGESKTVNVVAVKQSVATLNIKVYDSAIEEIKEDTATLGTGKLEQTGNAGETYTFAAADIEAAAGKIAIGDYTLDKFEYKDVKVEFGKSGEVVLKATKNLHGHGHTYIKFDETYYTKDDNDNWNKGTIYVCMDCKKALEADKLKENMTDRDKVYDASKLSGNKTKVWAWSLDHTAAALFKIPTELDDYLVDCVWDNPAFSSRTSATVEASGPEGKCDEGRVYTYTATAGSDKDVQKVTEKTEHAYKTEWKWAEDYSEAELKITCANEGCGEEHTGKTTEIEKLVTEPQCEINGYTSYTAKITLDGREFADKQDANVVPATGHTWDDNGVCTVCKEHKPLAKVTLKTKDTTYTGKAISIDPARVQSIQYNDKNEVVEQKEVEDAKVTYTYYTTSSCETKTNKDNAGASKSGGAPVKTGVYYVKASVAETPQDYKAGESDVTKLVIRPRATNVTVENISSGVQIKWDKKSEASGYYVYRKAQTSTKFSRIATVGKDTTSYTDKTAKAGRKYDYTVRTYGQDKAVAATYDTKGNYIMRLTQPSYTVENVYSSVMLTWKKVTGAEKYGVYRKAATSKKFSKIGVVKSGSKLEFKDTTAKNGNRYTYTVKAYAGSYKSSAYKPGKTMIRLVRPDVSSLKNSSSRKLTAVWSKNSKAEGYKVQYCTKSSFSGAKTKTASSNKITISSLTKGKTYYVRVRSYKKYSGRVYYSAWSKSKKVKISR